MGFDNIPTVLIQNNKKYLIHVIKEIINKSLKTGVVPDNLKISKITPIHKAGNKNNPENYRPISILPNLDKIISKIVNNQLMEYLQDNKLINDYQYGFRLKSNTQSAIFDIVSTLQNHRDQHRSAAIIFIDLQKAFDTVKRNRLISKLWHIGVRGDEYKWFVSYLTNRKQYMEIDGIRSELRLVMEGVPQGGNLASTLFLIFINDITEIQLNGSLYLYADDIALLYDGNDSNVMQNKIDEDMEKLKKWMDLQQLTINTKKTKYMLITNLHNFRLNVKYKNEAIEKVENFKYLGIHIDSKLNWKNHIDYVAKKTSIMAGLLKRISRACPSNLFKSIYYSLFHSHIMYGIIVWSCAGKVKMKRLQIIQNRAIRNLYGYPIHTNTHTIHTENNLLQIRDIVIISQITHIYNIKNHLIHSNTTITIAHNTHSINTRNSHTIRQARVKSAKMGLHSTLYTSIKNYNETPECYTQMNKKQFKINIRKYIYELHNSD